MLSILQYKIESIWSEILVVDWLLLLLVYIIRSKNILLNLLISNILLLVVFVVNQPLCEPCIDAKDCPPCLSDEQYHIIVIGIIINCISLLFYWYKNRK